MSVGRGWSGSNSFSAALRPVPSSTFNTVPPPSTADEPTRPIHNIHDRPHEPPSSCRAMPRQLSPEPESPTRHGDDNGQTLPGQPSSRAVEAGPFSFFDFPPEIRNMIYHISLQRPTCEDMYRCYYKQNAALPKNEKWARPHLKTPTVLLLCKRITDESMPILRARWFIIDRLPPCAPPLPDGGGGFMRLANFIGRETLQRLEYIDLRVGLGEGPLGSGWIWNRMLDELLAILNEKNALVHFRLLIRRCNKEENPFVWFTEDAEESSIRRKITYFKVSNPNAFKPCKITEETWRIDGQLATLVDIPPKCTLKPPCRSYPDPELFPGSIMQFVRPLPGTAWSDDDDDEYD
ncbi:hypothetical protein KVR01_002723 [Diaporthe batatas]|uniref:uncharacterized protein n=1 Tax=Diaporthe batatas TaxID=748121 RepID=UPI001D05861C|nr:uncharacterized protein KVR01_002723 [Diaporthe batatas]KAG8167034.1 hypothetical protein KVR01_002723 [Diaporthe batatas]